MATTEIDSSAPTGAAERLAGPPPWVNAYKLPAQLEAELAIAEIEEKFQELKAQLASATGRLPEATRYSRLLYEQGDSFFATVMDALQLLGASLSPEAPQSPPEARVADPKGRVFLVETVGSTGALRAESVRQLLDREFAAADQDPGWSGKTLLVANLQSSVAPADRTARFPESVVKMAARFGQCVLPSTQLFEAVRQSQIGMFDKAGFWDSLYNTAGVCTLAEPAALASEG